MKSVPTIVNLLDDLPDARAAEVSETLLERGAVRVERIVSHGQPTPEGAWYDQAWDEWVMVLRGRAGLRFEDAPAVVELGPGDAVLIPAHHRHRVEWTTPGAPTVWLAVHVRGDEDDRSDD